MTPVFPALQNYLAFGLRIRSAIALPDLVEASQDEQPDLTINLGRVPPPERGHHIWPSTDEFVMAVPPARYRVRAGREIIVDPLPDGSPSELVTFLLGSVMAALCLQRGLWPLHANAFLIHDQAVAIAGPRGAGKSTLAALLYDRGYGILCDDLCICRFDDTGRVWTWPGIARLKLRPDALAGTGRCIHAHPRVTAPVEKHHVALPPIISKAPLPLRQVYLLEPDVDDCRIGFRRLTPEMAITGLIAQTFRQHHVRDSGRQSDQFRWAVTASQRLAVFRAALPRGSDRFEESIELLIAHLRATNSDTAERTVR